MTPSIARMLAAVVTTAVPVAAFAGGADLRPKYKAGDALFYVSRADIDQTMTPQMEGGPQEMKSTIKNETGTRFRVLEVKPDGSTQFEWTLMFLTVHMTGPMATDFDSRDPAKQGPPMGPMLKTMVNKPATVTVDAAGKVTDLKGFDPASLGPMGQGFGQMFSKTGFEQFGLFHTAGAPNPAEPGAVWSHKFEIALPNNMGTMIQDSDYSLTKAEASKSAEIAVKGKYSMKEAPAGEDTPAMMTITQGDSSGTIQWNLATGQMDSSESAGNMDMTLTMPMGKMAMKQKITSKIQRGSLADFMLPAEKSATTQPDGK